jgi:hypothetical protein
MIKTKKFAEQRGLIAVDIRMQKLISLSLFMVLLAGAAGTDCALAADPLYQKPRLQRDFSRRQLELKLRQRQSVQSPALQPADPVQKQQLQQYHEQQQRQQLEFQEKQRQSILPGQSDPALRKNDQVLQRDQQAQDLKQKIEQPLIEDCCSLEPQKLGGYSNR